ncbi:pimeloyl-[acyl-carrier protein] methyl ester esterase [Natronospira proteinivora]|uniref:Pimeloyl-[acyl-carrier protein] methyl ester esterase n=1 Tax=Natronospira proteinivora TaxID=1807133 RepID=A0ABT1GDD7_9GAMM|nr:pimeloyl-ACP methyl ester esterase BioH [Natronospira proteinivora]MCP1727957.1 pimeloyl-[acyl-carrier protein] methyl ester esterase [Natronospira proteinivora]
MTPWYETSGDGPLLVLIHGWGLHSDVWDPILAELTARYRVTRIDLPGHGHSREVPVGESLADWAEAALSVAPEKASWLGWSLGGMVATRAALDAPERVERLLAVATTPRFVTGPDWPHAMAPETLEKFASELRNDFKGTVQQFLALQVQGDPQARPLLRQLREAVFRHGEPHHQVLENGLSLLGSVDLRAELPGLKPPTRVISGRLDRLTHPEAGRAMAEAIPKADYHCLQRTAHAPFLSDPEHFLELIHDFTQAG